MDLNTVNIETGFLWIAVTAFALLFVLCIILFILQMRLRRKYNRFMHGLGKVDVETLMHRYAEDLQGLKEHVQSKTEPRIAFLEQKLPSTLRNVGMVNYNAFEHMGNLMSFSIAAVDDQKNGFVLTGIYNRDSSYVYGKEITAGISNKELSKEEKEAYGRATKNNS